MTQKIEQKDSTIPRGHLNYLDGWRGLAIVFLLWGHFLPSGNFRLSTMGVNLFFVLSGWLMTRLLFVKNTPISVFYKRRISRIFPTLYFFISSVVIIFLVFSKHPIAWNEVAGASFLVRNYFPAGFGNGVPFDHIWSLSVEEHCYVLLSIIALLTRRNSINLTKTLAIFSILPVVVGALYSLQFSGPELVSQLIHSEVSAFGIFTSGFFLIYFSNKGIPNLPLVFYPALAIFGIVMHYSSVPRIIQIFFGVGAFALLINLLSGAPKLILSALSLSPLRQLGLWSFSIYLWQQPFYVLVHRNLLPPSAALLFSLVAGITSFYIIENPARNYLNSSWARE